MSRAAPWPLAILVVTLTCGCNTMEASPWMWLSAVPHYVKLDMHIYVPGARLYPWGLLWAALGLLWGCSVLLGGCSGAARGLLWAALGCSGLLWGALGCSGVLWAALGVHAVVNLHGLG